MKLMVHSLGAGGWSSSDKRQTSCVMIPELGIVFDAGTGFYRVRRNLQTPYLDVFISHLHDDHFHCDHVRGFLTILGVLQGKQSDGVTIYGRKGIGKYLDEKLFSPPRFPLSRKFHEQHLGSPIFDSDILYQVGEWQEDQSAYVYERPNGSRYADSPWTWQMTFVKTPHPSGGSLAFILDITEKETGESRRVVYSVDTTLDLTNKKIANFARLVGEKTADLLILECNFAERHKELARESGHSYPRLVIDFTKATKPRRLALTHHHWLAEEYGSGFMWEDQIAWEEVREEIPHAILMEDREAERTIVSL